MPYIDQEYEKLLLLGQGSFASIWKVRHRKLDYVRALKVSKEVIANENDHAYQVFLKECKVLLRIGNGCHPNIVRIYQPRLLDGRASVEMDYVKGVTLNDYLQKHKFMEMSEFYRLFEEIVGALAYCHHDIYEFLMDPNVDDLKNDPNDGQKYIIDPDTERKLVKKYSVTHNDLHSNNIMRRDYDGGFVLLDFGLAIQDGKAVKSSSRRGGALEYMAPEKFDDNGVITTQSDVYSLGILLYEALAGRVPFVLDDADSFSGQMRLFNLHKTGTPPAIEPLRSEAFAKTHPGQTYVKDYPDWLEAMILKCLAKNPEDRYTDAKELLVDYKYKKQVSSILMKLLENHTKHKSNMSEYTHQVNGEVFVYTIKGISFNMIRVKGGIFDFGAVNDEKKAVFSCSDAGINKQTYDRNVKKDEDSICKVKVSDYCIGETQVTQELWQVVMGGNPSRFKGSCLPVESVSWDDCQNFISKLNALTGCEFRLPTEVEWEWAARGGERCENYIYSGSNYVDKVAWYSANSDGHTHEVKSKQPNELGLYDMGGNVLEWCNDRSNKYIRHYYYIQGLQKDPVRIVRGSCWTFDSDSCQVHKRHKCYSHSSICSIIGFRLALSLSDNTEEFIDLGLRSGTLWKKTNETGFFSYKEALKKYKDKIPTKEQWEELMSDCELQRDKFGYRIIGPNGNFIFLQANGYRYANGMIHGAGEKFYYWSSTRDGSSHAWGLYGRGGIYSFVLEGGLSVRLVK